MAKVEPITPDKFHEVYDAFLRDDDPTVSKEDWNRLFRPYVTTEDDLCGYMLRSEGKVVGMLGAIMSQRMIAGRMEKFCNLHSWFVNPECRGYSLLLMRPILRMSDVTITDFTPTAPVFEMSKRFGMKQLDSTLRVMRPRIAGAGRRSNVTALLGSDIPDDALSPEQRKPAADHADAGLQKILFTDGKRQCHVVAGRVDRHRIPYCYVYSVSDSELFCQWSKTVRVALLKHVGGKYVALDDRLLAGCKLPASVRVPVATHALFRSSSVSAEQIDTLYTEVALLNLTTFPGVRDCLSSVARRFPIRMPRAVLAKS